MRAWGGHLMRVRDAAGRPLPFARLWSEISIVFMAGMETTGVDSVIIVTLHVHRS